MCGILWAAYARVREIDERQARYHSGWRQLRDLVTRSGKRSGDKLELLAIERQERVDESFELYSTAMTLVEERPALLKQLQPGAAAGAELFEKRYAHAYAFLSDRFRSIEVWWRV